MHDFRIAGISPAILKFFYARLCDEKVPEAKAVGRRNHNATQQFARVAQVASEPLAQPKSPRAQESSGQKVQQNSQCTVTSLVPSALSLRATRVIDWLERRSDSGGDITSGHASSDHRMVIMRPVGTRPHLDSPRRQHSLPMPHNDICWPQILAGRPSEPDRQSRKSTTTNRSHSPTRP